MLSPSRDNSETPADHWKHRIEQRTTRLPSSTDFISKPGSAAGARRRWGARLRFALLSAFFLGVGFVAWLAWRDLASAPVTDTVAQARFDFGTDGVLSENWVRERLGASSKVPAVSEIKRRLEEEPQVRRADVRRIPGGAVEVRLAERRPVMRMVARLPDGTVAPRLIATDGVIYEGVNVARMTFANLPALDGIHRNSPLRAEAHYDVIEGFETIAAFLDLAREKYPALYREWAKVSLKSYPGRPDAPGALIRVKPRLNTQTPDSAALVEIVFSPTGYAEELHYLSRSMDRIREQLRLADRSKYPAYRFDLGLMNLTDPRRPVPELRLIPVSLPPSRP